MSEEEERQPLLHTGPDSGLSVVAEVPTITTNSSSGSSSSNSVPYSVWGAFLIFFFPALGGLLFGKVHLIE